MAEQATPRPGETKIEAQATPERPAPPGGDGWTAQYIWLNGEVTEIDKAPAPPRGGLGGGSAVFEGIRAYWNEERQQLYLFRVNEHLERFLLSMKLMRMRRTYTIDELRQALIDLIKAHGLKRHVYLHPEADLRGGGFMGPRTGPGPGASMEDYELPAEVFITVRPSESRLLQERGSHYCVSSWFKVSDTMMPARVKAIANYHNSRFANMEARVNGYDGAFMLNARGELAEATSASAFLVRKGVLITPPLTADILESVTRDAIIELARRLGIPVQEREVDRSELYVADEVFTVGTAAEINPIVSVDRYTVGNGRMGPITAALERAYYEAVMGIDEATQSWRTPVYV